MELTRAELLARAGAAAGAAALGVVPEAPAAGLDTWNDVRASFALDGFHNLAGFLLAPHPRPVREAIERHRRGLDRNPSEYLHSNQSRLERNVRAEAAAYLGGTPSQVALTDSTTMGLGLLYGGLRVRPGDEVLTTTHDFYATYEALRLAGLRVRRVALYDDPARANGAEIVRRLRAALTRRTRVVALTWVHSSTGVKLPLREIGRAVGSRALLCVDGVHGLGVEEARPGPLGVDFLVAGCHKWLAGPRGTGVVWGRDWNGVRPTIPSFDDRADGAATNTPGGFHSFEHRWALADAFALQRRLGQGRVRARIHALATQLKDGLAGVEHVRLVTPRTPALSSGIVCCDVRGLSADEAVARLRDRHRVLATVTPYAVRYVRFGPGLYTSEDDVEAAVRAVRALAP